MRVPWASETEKLEFLLLYYLLCSCCHGISASGCLHGSSACMYSYHCLIAVYSIFLPSSYWPFLLRKLLPALSVVAVFLPTGALHQKSMKCTWTRINTTCWSHTRDTQRPTCQLGSRLVRHDVDARLAQWCYVLLLLCCFIYHSSHSMFAWTVYTPLVIRI